MCSDPRSERVDGFLGERYYFAESGESFCFYELEELRLGELRAYHEKPVTGSPMARRTDIASGQELLKYAFVQVGNAADKIPEAFITAGEIDLELVLDTFCGVKLRVKPMSFFGT